MTRRRARLLAWGLGALVLLTRLGGVPLVDPDEGRYAWAARVMAREGLELTPSFNEEPRFAKPAPLTWLQAVSMRILGETELGLRLPGTLLALGAVGATFEIASLLAGPLAGLLAASVLATSFRFAVIARQALVDGPLMLAFAAALYHLVRLVSGPPAGRSRALLAAHLWLAAGALLKGPVALLVPWLAIAAHGLGERSLGFLRGARVGRALGAWLLVTAPYYLGMLRIHGFRYLRETLWREHVERALGIRFGQPSPRGPDYFLRVLPADLMPWTPALVVAAVLLWLGWPKLGAAQRAASRFLASWAVAVVVLFSLPRFKLPHYVLPAYPALGVLLAVALAGPGVERRFGLVATLPAALLLGGVGILGALYLGTLGEGGATLLAVGAAGLVLAGLLVARRPEPRVALLALAGLAALAYLVLAADVAPRLARRFRPERELAAAIPAGARVGLYDLWSSAFVYHAGRRVEMLPDAEALESFAGGGGERVVMTHLPLLPELAGRTRRVVAQGAVLTPRLPDLWRPREPRRLVLVELAP